MGFCGGFCGGFSGGLKDFLGFIEGILREKRKKIKKMYITYSREDRINIYESKKQEKKILSVIQGEIKATSGLEHKNKKIGYWLMDIIGLDRLKKNKRFGVIYSYLNIKEKKRGYIIKKVKSFEVLQSVSTVFKSGLYAEREVYDMFGIYFKENSDLRRILTDYGFKGYPLRKDFPLSGYKQTMYSIIKKNLKYKKIKLVQEFRVFEYIMPWRDLSNKKRKNIIIINGSEKK